MRVLICPDRMGPLSSVRAGVALATGWPDADRRAVGEAGAGFLEATAGSWDAPVSPSVLAGVPVEHAVGAADTVLAVRAVAGPPAEGSPIPLTAGSAVLGEAMATLLTAHRPRRLLVDLAGLDVHDAGAGALAALGARAEGASLVDGVAGLTRLGAVDLAPARRLLAGTELVGVVPSPQRDDALLGLRGITSRRGRAAGADTATLLATDAALQRLTELAAPEAAGVPGAGACGGLGWAVLALGGRLATGPELGLATAAAAYDLVVTGCGVFDFASRGGGVVAAAARLAESRLAPCVVVAGEVLIGAREMRTMGIEAAYAVRDSGLDRPTAGDLVEDELVATVTRVSRSWRW